MAEENESDIRGEVKGTFGQVDRLDKFKEI
jgi:hypothetical protein